jgi:hypothetical protein
MGMGMGNKPTKHQLPFEASYSFQASSIHLLAHFSIYLSSIFSIFEIIYRLNRQNPVEHKNV